MQETVVKRRKAVSNLSKFEQEHKGPRQSSFDPSSPPISGQSSSQAKSLTSALPTVQASKANCTTIYLGNGVIYHIPPPYEELAETGLVPPISDILLDESILNNSVTIPSLAALRVQFLAMQAKQQAKIAKKNCQRNQRPANIPPSSLRGFDTYNKPKSGASEIPSSSQALSCIPISNGKGAKKQTDGSVTEAAGFDSSLTKEVDRLTNEDVVSEITEDDITLSGENNHVEEGSQSSQEFRELPALTENAISKPRAHVVRSVEDANFRLNNSEP